MANDLEWVRAAAGKGLSIFFADRNNFVVYRSADLGDHTWSMSDEELRKGSVHLVAGSRHDFIC